MRALLEFKGFKGVIEIRHSMKERVRIFVPSLIGFNEGKSYIEAQFQKIQGIKGIEVNVVTGTVLITYEDGKLQEGMILGILIKLLNLEQEIHKPKTSRLKKELDHIKEALEYGIYERSGGILDLKSLLILTFLFYGAKGLYFNEKTAKINPYSLLYWAYRNL